MRSATSHVRKTRQPTLTLCYLPHLDYGLQKWGPDPDDPRLAKDLREIDGMAGELIAEAEAGGDRVIVVSEYGIVPVRDAVHINRALRAAGLVRVREEMGRELLDAGASKAFAVSDHQIAHVYLQHGGRCGRGQEAARSTSRAWMWFSTRQASARWASIIHAPAIWWHYRPRTAGSATTGGLDDAKAPDFARTVDIHRKPGYDPMELFLDPDLRCRSCTSPGGSWLASSVSATCSM